MVFKIITEEFLDDLREYVSQWVFTELIIIFIFKKIAGTGFH